MVSVLEALGEVLFPGACPVCTGQGGGRLCAPCLTDLPLIGPPICDKCGKPCLETADRCRECRGRRLSFDRARSAGIYRGGLETAVKDFKYGNNRRLVTQLAALLARLVDEAEVDVVTWVPMDRHRQAKRGFNQSRLLAVQLARRLGRPCRPLLKTGRRAKEQNRLALGERRQNVAGAFRAAAVGRCRILLVDDVYTTGSTVDECSKVLVAAGAAVFVVTVARALKE